MKKVKILIVDDNNYKSKKLEETLNAFEEFDVYNRVEDGVTALDSIKATEPDVVLLDLILPKVDGLDLIKIVKEDDTITKKPILIVVTNVERQDFVSMALNFGADYYMINPSHSTIIDKIRQLISIKNMTFNSANVLVNHTPAPNNDIYVMVTSVLREIGVPAHLKGYNYLRDCIVDLLKTNEQVHLVKQLYPDIAKKYKANFAQVERSIRHAIEVTWKKGDNEKLNAMFGFVIDQYKSRPTNSAFIKTLVDNIRLQNLQEVS